MTWHRYDAVDDISQCTSTVGFHMTLWKPSAVAVDSNVDGYERATKKTESRTAVCVDLPTRPSMRHVAAIYFSGQLNKAANGTERWRIVKTLLHSDQNNTILSNADNETLCNSFSQFFVDKISDLKQAVTGDPYSNNIPPSPEDLN